MELDDLKSDWKNLDSDTKPAEALREMIQGNNHPVLKGIKKQLGIETTFFLVFLLIYYSGFDGNQKPLYANVLLVTSMLLVIVHNILGYRSAQNIVSGFDLTESLKNYLTRIRRYAVVSVVSRVAAFLCLISFFSSTVPFFSKRHLILLGVALLIIFVQVFFLSTLWKKRIGSLELLLRQLKES